MKRITTLLLGIFMALAALHGAQAQGPMTNHGGTVSVGKPSIHAIFEGTYDPLLQSQLTTFLKNFAPAPDPILLQYAGSAAGSWTDTFTTSASSNLSTSQAQADIDSVAGSPGLLSKIFLHFNARLTGHANDVWIIFAGPGATLVGGDEGYHYNLMDRKGTDIVVQYSTLAQMVYVVTHELAEDLSDPLPGRGWYGTSIDDEIADRCEPQTKPDTLQGVTYNVALLWDNASSSCK